MKKTVFGILSVILWVTTSAEENWTRFRGDHGAGLSKQEAPTALDKNSLLWSAALPGPGSSSPVIWENLLFVTSEDRKNQTINLSCLDATKGSAKWTQKLKIGDYHLHRFNNTAASSPAVDADKVVISWFDGAKSVAMLSAFDHSGKKLWDFEIGPLKSKHGANIHPVIHEDRVVICHLHLNGGYVGAISGKTGKAIWKTPYPGGSTSYVTPLIRLVTRPSGKGHEVIVAATSIGMVGLDLKDGKEQWAVPKLMKERCIVSPFDVLAGTGDENVLIAAGCKNGVYFTVRPPQLLKGDGWSKPEVVWKMDGKTPYVPTPVSDGAIVYALADGGALAAMDSLSGELLWKEQLPANFYASPLLVGGKFYALSREGEMFVAKVGKSYQEIARSPLSPGPEVQWADATPVAVNGKLFVRLGSRLDCFGQK